jgi:methionine sulfoxide reductase heme-binding subunit
VNVAPHIFWITSRAAGGAALLLASASVAVGLMIGARRSGATSKRDLRSVHEALSLTALAMVAVHGLALLGDSYLDPGLAGILVPFASFYRPVWTALGILSGYGLAALGLSYYLRDRIGAARWRRLHRLTAVFWLAAIAHTIGAGSDAVEPWFLILNGVVIVPAALLLILRWIGRASGERVPASAVGQTSITVLMWPTALLLVAAAAIAVAGCGGGVDKASGHERPLAPSGQTGPSHTVLIVLENHELNEVIGGSESSKLDELSKWGRSRSTTTRSHTPRFPTILP